jgi:hypothetical protein
MLVGQYGSMYFGGVAKANDATLAVPPVFALVYQKEWILRALWGLMPTLVVQE